MEQRVENGNGNLRHTIGAFYDWQEARFEVHSIIIERKPSPYRLQRAQVDSLGISRSI